MNLFSPICPHRGSDVVTYTTFLNSYKEMMGMFWKKSKDIVQINEKDCLSRSILEIKTQEEY